MEKSCLWDVLTSYEILSCKSDVGKQINNFLKVGYAFQKQNKTKKLFRYCLFVHNAVPVTFELFGKLKLGL